MKGAVENRFRISCAKRWCIVATLVLFTSLSGLSGCDGEPPKQPRPTPARTTPAVSPLPLDIYVGPTLMRIPWNMLSHSPDQGRAFIGPQPYKTESVLLGVVYPDMEGQKLGRPGGPHTLFIEVRGYPAPAPPPAEQRQHFVNERLSRLDGPFVNKKLGMREWRGRNGGPAEIFGLADPSYRAPDGLEPLIACNSGTNGLLLCDGGGAISPELLYSFRFAPSLLPEWPAIDTAVRKLIESMVVRGE